MARRAPTMKTGKMRRRGRGSSNKGPMDAGTIGMLAGGTVLLIIIVIAASRNRENSTSHSPSETRTTVINKVQYRDAEGNLITKAQYDALQALNRAKEEAEKAREEYESRAKKRPVAATGDSDATAAAARPTPRQEDPAIPDREGAPRPSWMVAADGRPVTEIDQSDGPVGRIGQLDTSGDTGGDAGAEEAEPEVAVAEEPKDEPAAGGEDAGGEKEDEAAGGDEGGGDDGWGWP